MQELINCFRRDEDDRFVRLNYGENSRVLKRAFERLSGTAADLQAIMSVDVDGWREAAP